MFRLYVLKDSQKMAVLFHKSSIVIFYFPLIPHAVFLYYVASVMFSFNQETEITPQFTYTYYIIFLAYMQHVLQ